MIGLKKRTIEDKRLVVPGERGAWLDRHDAEAQSTLAVLVAHERTRQAVAYLEYHVARTADIRFMVEDPTPEWAVALVRLNQRRTDTEVEAVRLLMRAPLGRCGQLLPHAPHPWLDGTSRFDCDGSVSGVNAA